jgi:transglutaminase-like putative cysteine protease
VNIAGVLGSGHRVPQSAAQLRTPLTSAQIGWLGALLLSAQLPQAPHLPIWVAVTGILLVALRLVVLRHDRQRPQAPPPRIPSWTLVVFAVAAAFAVRASFGYLSGRDPSVAFLYILVAIKFLEMRTTRDGTLLVCLSCFLLITPFFYGQSPFAALAVLPAVVLVGAALDAMTAGPANGSAAITRSAAIRRSGLMILQGVPVAVLLFVLFPRLAGPLWGLPSDHAAQTGLSDTMEPGQISELSLSDAVAFRVDFDGPAPPPRERYWRGPVLSRFDGRTWSAGNLQYGGSLVPAGEAAITYTVSLEPSNRMSLFALDLPVAMPRAEGGGNGEVDGAIAILTRDQQLLARAPLSQPLRYVQQSSLRSSFAGNPRFEATANLRLPDRNPRTWQFARELRAQYPDDRQLVDAVLTWFNRENFVYTMSPPLLNQDTADEFLFDTRRGFCEHFASAFVVLLRASGIPARVVTGYQGGTVNPRGNYMIVRQSDAHAWAEALIAGRWQRFDPTAAVSPSRIEIGLGGALPAGERVPFLARLDASWLKSLQLAWDALNHDWRRNVVGFNHARQRALWRQWQLDGLAPWQIGAIAAAVLFAWAGLLAAWLLFRRRRQERALALWDDLCRRLARAGLPRHGYEGPVAFAQRAAQRWPQFAIAFAAIGQSFATLRYGATAGPRQRDALIATLERAIEVLPSPAALRQAV